MIKNKKKLKISYRLLSITQAAIFLLCLNTILPVRVSAEEKPHSVILLVLGSNSPEMRKHRVSLACDLIKTKRIRFDKIILSGGCGAHGTDKSNCEASDMERLIKSTCNEDISAIPIYKEEKSGYTLQNYCFCRDLKDNGDKLIKKGDTLYVVSTHYHALSVSACFKNEGMDAHYYYSCGDSLYDGIPPSVKEVTESKDSCFRDYAGIALNCNSRNWCERFQVKNNGIQTDK
jgi:hypothetical protein